MIVGFVLLDQNNIKSIQMHFDWNARQPHFRCFLNLALLDSWNFWFKQLVIAVLSIQYLRKLVKQLENNLNIKYNLILWMKDQ